MAKMPMEQAVGTTLDTRVQLTADTNYTCTKNGYFRIYIPSAQNKYAQGYVDSQLLMTIASPISGSSATETMQSLYVNAGTVIKYRGSADATGYFYPIS